MHPVLTKEGGLPLYLTAWLIVGLMLAALVAVPGNLEWPAAAALAIPLSVLYGFMNLSSWYLCRAFPLQTTESTKLLALIGVAGVLSTAVWTLAGYGWSLALSRFPFAAAVETVFIAHIPMMAGVGVVLFLLSVAVHYLIIAFETSREAERASLEMKLLAQEAELRALRSQIDPHFLYNSLHSISALTVQNPSAARSMTLKLAEFLRKSQKLGARELIRLEDELSLTLSFLDIERIRFGSRLNLRLDIEELCKSCLVPPLLLQPLIENAVRHGIAQLVDGGTIRISAEWRGSGLHITVENPIESDGQKRKGAGLGLENVRKRLRAMYRSDARLDVSELETVFRAELILPARTAEVFGNRNGGSALPA